jgi:high-affinity iron transporter
MDSLVITFREGIEAALVIGIMLAFVRRTGRNELGRWILAGTVAAVASSIAMALSFGLSGINTDNPMFEGVLYAVAAVAVLSMVGWMWRNSRNVKAHVESRIGSILEASRTTTRIGLGLFTFSFFMVAREGVETVLFISAGALGGTYVPSLILGGVAGLGLAVLYGVLFARGSARIDLRLFFTLTSVVLVLLSAKLIGGSIHEFEEAGVLPMSEAMAQFFDVFGGSAVIDWLFLAALVVPLAVPLLKRRSGGHSAAPEGA